MSHGVGNASRGFYTNKQSDFRKIITTFDVFSDFGIWISFMQFPFHAKNIVVVQCNVNPMLLGLERFMATVYVKQYEQIRMEGIAVGVIVTSWTLSATINYVLWSRYFYDAWLVGIIVNGCFAVLTIGTVIFYIWLSKKNRKHFTQTAATSALSERYQTAENIRHLRAIKQNASVNLVANSLIVIFNTLFLCIQFQGWGKTWEKRLDGVWNITFSLECILLPLPFLHVTGRLKKIKCSVRRFLNVNTTNDSQTVASFELTKLPPVATIKSVTGQQVPLTGTQTDYFKMFDKSWETGPTPVEQKK
uniref:7TM_GPCR_Srx domain-containing protein n=1 Tax=Panagrellus redivivus TaxID=6233 RepID=A0A7E4WDL8_PANRE